MSGERTNSSIEEDTDDGTQSYDESSSSSTGRSSSFVSCSSHASSTKLRVNNEINISQATGVHVGPTFIANTWSIDPKDNFAAAGQPPEILPNCKTQSIFLGQIQELLGSSLEDVKTKKRCVYKRVVKKYWHWILLFLAVCILLPLLFFGCPWARKWWYHQENSSTTTVTTHATTTLINLLSKSTTLAVNDQSSSSTPILVTDENPSTTLAITHASASPSPLPKSTNLPAIVQPTTALPSTTIDTTVAPPVKYEYNQINRTTWGGRSCDKTEELPENCKTRENVRAIAIIVNSTDSGTCDALDQCKTILRKLENDSGQPLNFNFVIDSNGTVYEARGWNYIADEDDPNNDIIKIGFIGACTKPQLNTNQTSALQEFIARKKTHFSPNLSIKPQCCTETLNETGATGYGLKEICDLFRTGFFNIDKDCIMDTAECGVRPVFSWLPNSNAKFELFCDSYFKGFWI